MDEPKEEEELRDISLSNDIAPDKVLAVSASIHPIPAKPAKRPGSLHKQSKKSLKGLAVVSLSALGVVYGDIGTSPLYVFKSVFGQIHVSNDNVLGVTSLIIYCITLVVCIKYLIFVMSADQQREGGVFALLSLILFGNDNGKHNVLHDAVPLKRVSSSGPSPSSSMVEFANIEVDEKKLPHRWIANRNLRRFFIFLSMVGSGLLLGDGVITPAISVLSAVEGLQIASKSFAPAVLPITVVILVALFVVQRFGTTKVGTLFGPIMVAWFCAIAGIGIYNISGEASIFKAFNPYYAVLFFKDNGVVGWEALGAVVLCITGCEAMYADMGHFGKNAVRISWLIIVFPSLVLNYLGQGALLLRHPEKVDDPFFHMIPEPLFWLIFILSILATIIASQALISGAFSLTQQAVALSSFPRLKIVHTSKSVEGQIYIPAINMLLMVSCVLLVIGFRTSDELASAYGVAVCGDMLLTSIMFLSLAYLRWRWSPIVIAWLAFQFAVVDLAFLSSNLRKVPSGGWFPLMFATVLVTLMFVWRSGQMKLKELMHNEQAPVEKKDRRKIVEEKKEIDTHMYSCLAQVKGYHKHEPFVARSESRVIKICEDMYRIVLESGYMETTLDIDNLQEVALLHDTHIEFPSATYYLGNELVTPKPGTWTSYKLQIELFNLLLQFSHKSTASSFHIPDRNLIYVGNNYLL